MSLLLKKLPFNQVVNFTKSYLQQSGELINGAEEEEEDWDLKFTKQNKQFHLITRPTCDSAKCV